MEKPDLRTLKPMPMSRVSTRKPIIIGHRGTTDLAPENTFPAFEIALQAGADGVEFDVQRTIDGELIIFHDEQAARTSDGEGFLPEMTFEQVRSLDVGCWFDKRFAGTRVPTLAELFDWMQGNDLLMFLELKEPFRYPGIEQQIVDLIRQNNLVDRVQVRSFYHVHLHNVNQIAPEIAISELWLNYVPTRDEITYPTMNLKFDMYSEAIIKQFHEWGCSVTAWVVDDIDVARQLAQWGIDGITTNNPVEMLKLFDPE